MSRHVFACGMSRSGTTLLTTILDSHPDVSMGYELLPAGLPRIREIVELIRAGRAIGDTSSVCADHIKQEGHKTLSTFVRRCGRTLVEPIELEAICTDFLADGHETFDALDMRARLSMAVVEVKMAKEHTSHCGYKINAPSVDAFFSLFPESHLIYIVRDPRDVVASHFANGFDRTIEHICRAWNQYLDRFIRFCDTHPERGLLVRYEDLVRHPDRELPRILEAAGLEAAAEVERFFDSKASVHLTGHRNARDLGRDFFTTSVARWQRDLDIAQVREIQDACRDKMEQLGFTIAPVEPLVHLSDQVRAAKRRELLRKKRYFRNQYGELVFPHRADRVNLTWAEAAEGSVSPGQKVLILRHDVDHDFETALRMARWEHEHQLRATYCILHSTWYYGHDADGTFVRHHEMVECCRELEALGHEINFHNNTVVRALQTGEDARAILERELMFFRLHGITVRGSSTHGDRLCRELDFRNYELFAESVYETRGGPRMVVHEGNRVELGAFSMHDVGLDYEAYDLPRDHYISDSGGRLRTRLNTRGRAGKRRHQLDPPPKYPHITGILTHPVWWDFERDAPAGTALEIEGSAAADTDPS